MAFNRVADLYVGNFVHGNNPENQGYLVSSLSMEFEVERSVVWFENSAKFRIWNASENTLSNILTKGNSVLFRAGYADETAGTIFSGQIGWAWPERRGRDLVTTIVCTSGRGGQYPLARVKVSMSFRKGTSISRILEDIAAYAGLAYRGSGNIGDVALDQQIVFTSDLSSALRLIGDLILSQYGASLYVDNNELLVFRSHGDTSSLETAHLTPDSGLISALPYRDEGKNKINYRQDLAYWSGYSSRLDSVVMAEKAVADAQASYKQSPTDQAIKALQTAKKDLEEQRARAVLVQTQGREPEKEEDIARRNMVSFRCVMNPSITPNTLVSIDNREIPGLLVKGTYRVEKCRYRGDNIGGDFFIDGEAFA